MDLLHDDQAGAALPAGELEASSVGIVGAGTGFARLVKLSMMGDT